VAEMQVSGGSGRESADDHRAGGISTPRSNAPTS
jgi:hypothetical protein